MLRASRTGSEDCMNCCGRKPEILRPHTPGTLTRVIVTFRYGFGAFSGGFRQATLAAAEDKAQSVWRRRPESNRGPRICKPWTLIYSSIESVGYKDSVGSHSSNPLCVDKVDFFYCRCLSVNQSHCPSNLSLRTRLSSMKQPVTAC